MEIKIVKDRTLSSHDYLMGQESTRVAYQKSLTEVCETFVHVTERLQGTLEFATMFEDTDSIEDRQRIIKRVDDVISTFLKLVNDYYRLEFMLRFKVGAWQSLMQMRKYDEQIQLGFHTIDAMWAVLIGDETDHDEE